MKKTFRRKMAMLLMLAMAVPSVAFASGGGSGPGNPGSAVISTSGNVDKHPVSFSSQPNSVAVVGVTIDQRNFSLLVGATKSLTVSIAPVAVINKSVSWSSSDPAVATVDENGKVTAVSPGTADIQATSAEDSSKFDSVTVQVTKASFTNVSVHDPSIVKDGNAFYVFGSNLEAAKSTDLMNWTRFTNGDTTPGNVLYGDMVKNLAGSFAWAGNSDADSTGEHRVWAPYVFYNEDYKNKDGSTGAYMIYYSTSSTYIRSAIGYAVSQNIEGPYTYVDTIVYTGFTQNDAYDNRSVINKKWTNTNIQALIDNGILQGPRSEWFNGNGSYNNDLFPNAIDPDLFYDKDGKLWMTYGSWSGGIFELEIDKESGKPIYTGADGTTADGRMVDRYFGTKIAGGYQQSGEGPFVVYDKKTGYYFLNVTYGWLESGSGYNMRMFRATSPNGPFVDAQGKNAVMKANTSNQDYGNKMMGDYLFQREIGDPGTGTGISYVSPGHNSVYFDKKTGQYFLVFHTRFPEKGNYHEVRVHQMFMNKDNWPVVAPYRYTGEKLEAVTEQNLVGEYKFINHGMSTSGIIQKSVFIRLNNDHTITGDVAGSWSKVGDNLAEITIDGVSYNGVFARLWDDTSGRVVMTFTAMSGEGVTVWGSKLQDKTDQEIVEDVLNDINLGDTNNVVSNLTLPVEGTRHAMITWQTSNDDAVTATGVVTRPEPGAQAATAVLTATVTKGNATDSRAISVTILPRQAARLKADYSFDGNLNDTTGISGAGTVTGNRIDNTGGTITYAQGMRGDAAVFDGNSGVRLPDGLISSDSYSVSLWVKPDALTRYTPTFFGAKDSGSWISILPQGLTKDNTMLWSHNVEANGEDTWYETPSGMTVKIGEWNHLAITIEKGTVTVYVNGVQKFKGTNFPDVFTSSKGIFGLGVNWWDVPFKGMIDGLQIYDGVLTSQEIKNMVFDPAIKVSGIRLGLTEKRISAGNAFTPSSVSVSPAFAGNQVLVWSSADPSIATVDEISGQVTAVKAGSTTITATATDGSGTAASYTLYVMDSAIVYYTFDGSLLDSTGYGTGTVTGNRANNTGGTITYSDGVSGQAAVLNGSSGIRLPNGLISGYKYTVSMSVYLEQANQYTSAFFGSATPDSWISLAPRGPGDAQPTMLWSGSAWYNASTGIQIPTGTWVDLAFTVDNGTVTVYVDGVAKYTGTSFPNVLTIDDAIFALGVNYWDNPFIGKIDELRIYDKALTADQIQTLSQ